MKIEIWYKDSLKKSDINRVHLLQKNSDFEMDIWRLRIIFSYEDNFDKKLRPDYYDKLFKENKELRKQIIKTGRRHLLNTLLKEIDILVRKYNIPLSWKTPLVHIVRKGAFILLPRRRNKITFGLGEKEFSYLTNIEASETPSANHDGLHIVLNSVVTKNELILWTKKHWEEIENLMQKRLPDNVGLRIKSINFLERIASLRDKKGLSFKEITDKLKANDEQKITLYYQRYKRYLKSIKKK